MPRLARTPAEVIASEISYASPETAWADALAIASVISNRALALDVTQQQVVGVQKEFNAYNKAMVPGADIDLAQQAIDNVAKFGPTTAATFYAMPYAVKNLPATREFDTAVPGGHQYFTEKENKGIRTSIGTRVPTDIATVRAAVAQRQAYELALADEKAMPVPEERPPTIPMTQNPAFLAGVPLDQLDPNISTGVPAMSALTMTPNLALAQQMQTSAPAQAMSQAQFDAAFGEDPNAMIASPQALAAALSRMTAPVSTPLDISQAMDDAISASVAASSASKTGRIQAEVDPARMADNAPLSDADRALQDMMKSSVQTTADENVASRFAGPVGPVTQRVQSVSVPGEVQDGGYVLGSAPAVDFSAVPARSVPTARITPDMIDNPQALQAALSSLGVAAPALPEAEVAKSARIGAIDTTSMDQSRFSPSPIDTADAALRSAIDRTIASGPSQQTGLNSPAHQALQAAVENNLGAMQPASDEANAAGKPLSFERSMIPADPQPAVADVSTPNFNQALNPALPGLTTPNITQSAFSEKPATPPAVQAIEQQMTPEQEAKSFAEEVASQKTSRISPLDATRIATTTGIPAVTLAQPATFDMTNNPLQAAIDSATAIAPAPALETITVPDMPKVATPEITPAVTPEALPSTDRNTPAVTARTASAMDVWSGKATTGIATDGSTVSRMEDGRIGRYVPEYDYTVYSPDEGATWGAPTKGNMLTGVASTQTPSVSPNAALSKASGITNPSQPATAPQSAMSKIGDSVFSGGTVGALGLGLLGAALAGPVGGVAGGLLGRQIGGKVLGDGIPDQSPFSGLLGLLSGLGSPTGVAPGGTTGGMSVASDGPAGTPSGDDPSGGYGTTGGVDPEGTH